MSAVLVTTIDNPFNPFTQFEDWYRFDEDHGYHTCAYLARIADTSYELSDADYEKRIDQAVDEIVEMNVLGIYKKVREEDQIHPVPVKISELTPGEGA